MHRDLRRLAVDVVPLVEEPVGELLVRADLGQLDVDDVAPRLVGDGLDQRRLARAGRAPEQQAELVREAGDLVLARLGLEGL